MTIWLKKVSYQNVSEDVSTLLAEIDKIDSVLKEPEWVNSKRVVNMLVLDKVAKLREVDRLVRRMK